MGVPIGAVDLWGAGNLDPSDARTYKYGITLTGEVDIVKVEGNTATLHLTANMHMVNSPGGPKNSIAASDFAVLTVQHWDWTYHQFTPGVNYYQHSIPFIPNADAALNDRMLFEFRGDTYVGDGNYSSLWTKNGGLVINHDGSSYERDYSLDATFTINVAETGDFPVLCYTRSGWTAGTTAWYKQDTWLSWFDLKWIASLNFDGQGATSNVPKNIREEVSGGSVTYTIEYINPIRDSHNFKGWALSPGGNPQYYPGQQITITKENPTVTLYAVWALVHKLQLVYDPNPGAGMVEAAISGMPSNQSYEGEEDTAVFTVSSQVPTRKNWIFHGWSRTKKVCDGLTWYFDKDVDTFPGERITVSSPDGNATVTLYAVWEYTYRPGMIYAGGWVSCDADVNLMNGRYAKQEGHCDIRRGGRWVEMRTRAYKTGVSNAPNIRRNGNWDVQYLIGDRAGCHDVSY